MLLLDWLLHWRDQWRCGGHWSDPSSPCRHRHGLCWLQGCWLQGCRRWSRRRCWVLWWRLLRLRW